MVDSKEKQYFVWEKGFALLSRKYHITNYLITKLIRAINNRGAMFNFLTLLTAHYHVGWQHFFVDRKLFNLEKYRNSLWKIQFNCYLCLQTYLPLWIANCKQQFAIVLFIKICINIKSYINRALTINFLVKIKR